MIKFIIFLMNTTIHMFGLTKKGKYKYQYIRFEEEKNNLMRYLKLNALLTDHDFFKLYC